MKNTLCTKSPFSGIATGIALAAALCLAAPSAQAGGKLSVEKQTTVNASPETAWKMIGHFNHLDVWHPVVVMSTLKKGQHNKEGAVRVLTLADGAEVTEVLVKHSDYDKSYTYRITGGPLPVKNYESVVAVKGAPGGKATVTWSGTFDAKDAPDEKAVETMAGVYEAGLGSLARHFN
ncbi:MAG: SRPBCC family protein [Gammaproteobacteria bacterium]|nr:SRPBCC family protein [Gammaproteobacteria bacterium]MDD9868948.1 SRPBCC family protein [Gammaproteobacteria bacterium]